ncbi:tetratricopeptide repeat protein [Listeria grandensis]|uniref:tetratricopeptide repeat protein n=1 Tax=Listeria grandensis TaxID=1494963 RepID=UPI00162A517F|nr:tetratricopeptide repeat protein [Listeria grandensis]MBC1473414.1 tetratricopeptide repeat protein [Listeria grandensis]
MKFAEQMLAALEQENLPEAEKYFQQTLQDGTDEEQYWLAEQLMQLGFLEEAEDLYELLLAKYKDEGELLVRAAEVAIEKDDIEAAMEYLEQVHTQDDAYPESLLVLADLYQMQGLFEVTEAKLQQAKSLLPNEAVIDFALGEFYLSTARFASAVQSYQAVLDAGMTEIAGSQIFERIAESLASSGSFEEAMGYYEKALAEQVDVNTLFGLGLTSFQAKDYTKAIAALEQLQEHDPGFTTLYTYLAKSYEENGEPEKALDALVDGLKQDEFNKELFFEAGKLAWKNDRTQDAEHYLRQAIALDPEFIEAILEVNKILLKKADYEGVVELVESLEREIVTEPQIFWDVSVAYQELDIYNKAKENYELAHPHFAGNATFLKEYGLFLREDGDVANSEQVLAQYLTMEPGDEEILSLLGY